MRSIYVGGYVLFQNDDDDDLDHHYRGRYAYVARYRKGDRLTFSRYAGLNATSFDEILNAMQMLDSMIISS